MVASLRYSDVYAKLDRDRWTPLMLLVQQHYEAALIAMHTKQDAAAATVAKARMRETPEPKGEPQ